MTKKQIKLTKNGKNELIMTKNEENQNDGFRVFYNKKESKCQQMLVSFFMSEAIVKKHLNQTQVTTVFTALRNSSLPSYSGK